MKTASKMSDHAGVRYRYCVEKHNNGEYRAELTMFYPSGMGGKITITNDEFKRTLNTSLPFFHNPAGNDFIEKYAQGHIDCIMQKLETGDIDKMANDNAFKPRTNPTPEQLKKMADETERLIATFSAPGLAKIGGELQRATVQEWKNRGRVSAQWANDLCKNKIISDAGFTRESLRPDVPYWYVD